MTLLRIDSSARRSSVSRQLTAKFVEAWKKQNPAGEVIERDLSTTLLPHITDDWSATYGDPSKLRFPVGKGEACCFAPCSWAA